MSILIVLISTIFVLALAYIVAVCGARLDSWFKSPGPTSLSWFDDDGRLITSWIPRPFMWEIIQPNEKSPFDLCYQLRVALCDALDETDAVVAELLEMWDVRSIFPCSFAPGADRSEFNVVFSLKPEGLQGELGEFLDGQYWCIRMKVNADGTATIQ